MGNRKWTSKEKLNIVLEGQKSGNIAETCRKHGIFESQYFQWKNKLLESADNVFKNKEKDPEKEKLKNKVEKLKGTVVQQSYEIQSLKKNDI